MMEGIPVEPHEDGGNAGVETLTARHGMPFISGAPTGR
ncbi:hypothetical protein BN2537_6565 [Streptomyces venezuelae]|nr:hypothetical protein BN2537_6565 [Streptomyces venezuelae]